MSNQEQNNSEQTNNRSYLAELSGQDESSSSEIIETEKSTLDKFRSAISANEDIESRKSFEQSRQKDQAGFMEQSTQPSSTPRRIEQVDEKRNPFEEAIASIEKRKENPFAKSLTPVEDQGENDSFAKPDIKDTNNITERELSTPNSQSEVENLLGKLESLETQLFQTKKNFLDNYDQIRKSQY